MSSGKSILLVAVLWAIAFIAAALNFKGHRLGDWIEGALYVGFITHLSWMEARGLRCRRKLERQA